MVIAHVVVQIRLLRKGFGAELACIGLLARVLRAHMGIQPTFLRKELPTCLTFVGGKVRILVIDNQTLFSLRNLSVASWHIATPQGAILDEVMRKRFQRHYYYECNRVGYSRQVQFFPTPIVECRHAEIIGPIKRVKRKPSPNPPIAKGFILLDGGKEQSIQYMKYIREQKRFLKMLKRVNRRSHQKRS